MEKHWICPKWGEERVYIDPLHATWQSISQMKLTSQLVFHIRSYTINENDPQKCLAFTRTLKYFFLLQPTMLSKNIEEKF